MYMKLYKDKNALSASDLSAREMTKNGCSRKQRICQDWGKLTLNLPAISSGLMEEYGKKETTLRS